MLNWVGMGADVVGAVDWARTLRDTCAGASAAAAWGPRAGPRSHSPMPSWHFKM